MRESCFVFGLSAVVHFSCLNVLSLPSESSEEGEPGRMVQSHVGKMSENPVAPLLSIMSAVQIRVATLARAARNRKAEILVFHLDLTKN